MEAMKESIVSTERESQEDKVQIDQMKKEKDVIRRHKKQLAKEVCGATCAQK